MSDTPSDPGAAGVPLFLRRCGYGPDDALSDLRRRGEIVPPEILGPAENAFLLTRYDDVRQVLGDTQTFTNTADVTGGQAPETTTEAAREGRLMRQDPPQHTRLRRMLAAEFTGRRVQRLAPRVTEVVEGRLDALEQAGPPAELVEQYCLPIPSLMICELLGVAYSDRAEFQERSRRMFDFAIAPDERAALEADSERFMSALVDAARADPGDDLLGMLIREHGDELGHAELVAVAGDLLVAGHETTANMISMSILALLQHPEQLALVRDRPGAEARAVEELLRWLCVVPIVLPRVAVADTAIRGVPVPSGSVMVCSLPSANRDPALIDDPDRLDVTRGAHGHVALGHGVHHCLGAPLVRLELATAVPGLLRRFPGLALDADPADLTFPPQQFIRGVNRLPVTW